MESMDYEDTADNMNVDQETEIVAATKNNNVSEALLNRWRISLQHGRNRIAIVSVINAFHAAIVSIRNDNNQEPTRYKVEGVSLFNGVIQLCVLELGPAMRKFLRLKKEGKIAINKSKHFPKIKVALRLYLWDLNKLIDCVSSSKILTVLLKHMHYMTPFLVRCPKHIKPTLKLLIKLWGTVSYEDVRVLAFMCILRVLNSTNTKHLSFSLKKMHLTFVRNSKFVNVEELALCNFMRRSLVEVFAMDLSVSYNFVFLYIRQLSVHLRNAITLKTSDSLQVVYNWQFINCLHLWTNFLSVCYDKPNIQQLIYPLTQIIIGTIKLTPTAQYYPLRFHCLKMLIELSHNTDTFIPLHMFILEILENYDFNKKHTKMSMRPVDFTCVLRLSNIQLEENGVKDAFIEHVYGLLLEYLANNSHSLAFPDLSFLCIVQIKKFIKKCKILNYCKKLKYIVEKVEKTNEVIEKERLKLCETNLSDLKSIEAVERQIRNQKTPILEYYESWQNMKK